MTSADRRLAAALNEMLEADAAQERDRTWESWERWQRAATDYWVLRNPGFARFRRADPARTPTVEELRERASLVAGALDGVPRT